MAKVIVCEVYEYEAPTTEEAELAIQEVVAHYEHEHFVIVAQSLDEMPHPVQVGAIREAFGN